MSTIEKFRPVASTALPNTMKIIDKTWNQIKLIWKLWGIASLIFKLSYISYLIYALATGLGNLYVNIGFLVFSVAYLVFDQTTRAYESPTAKKKTRAIRKWFRCAKIGADVVKLSMAVYGVCISWANPSVVGVVLAVFSALVFVFDVAFEIIYSVIASRYEQLCEAVEHDVQALKSAKKIVESAGEAVKVIAKPSIDAAKEKISSVGRFFSGLKKKDGEAQDSSLGRAKTKVAKLRDQWKANKAQKKADKASDQIAPEDKPADSITQGENNE